MLPDLLNFARETEEVKKVFRSKEYSTERDQRDNLNTAFIFHINLPSTVLFSRRHTCRDRHLEPCDRAHQRKSAPRLAESPGPEHLHNAGGEGYAVIRISNLS